MTARLVTLARAAFLLAVLWSVGASRAPATSQAEALFPIVEHGKWGLIDRTGRIVVAPRFDAIAPYDHGTANESWFPGAPNSAFDYMALTEGLRYHGPIRTQLIGVEIRGKWGFVDRADRTVVEPRFDKLDYHTDDPPRRRLQVRIGEKWGYITPIGKLVIEAMYDLTSNFVDDVALTRTGNRWRVIDSAGAEVAVFDAQEVEYDDWKSGRDLLRVKIRGHWGAVDRLGRLVITPQFGGMGQMAEGLFAVCVGIEREDERRVRCLGDEGRQRWGYADRSGTVVIPASFDGAGPFDRGTARVSVGQLRAGIIDRTGRFVVQPKDNLTGFVGPVAMFKRNGKWGLLDRSGRVVVEATFDDLGWFADGLALARRDGRTGYIDTTGRFAIEPRFEDAGSFSEGLAPVSIAGKWGYIDRTGAVVIPPQFLWRPTGFLHGLATVGDSDGQSFTDFNYIDLNARVVYSMRFMGVWSGMPRGRAPSR